MKVSWFAATSALVVSALAAEAQSVRRQNTGPARWELAGGLTLWSGYPIGSVTAEIRRNSPGVPPPFTLLSVATRVAPAAGLDVRLTRRVAARWSVEFGGAFSRPAVVAVVALDPESSDPGAIESSLAQYEVGAALAYRLTPASSTRRVLPYVIGGGGYTRQVFDGRLRIDAGHSVHAGGGVRFVLGRVGAVRTARPRGIRSEVRLVRRGGELDLQDRSRLSVSASALGFVSF